VARGRYGIRDSPGVELECLVADQDAIGLSVGAGRVGTGAAVLEAEGPAGLGEGARTIGAAIANYRRLTRS